MPESPPTGLIACSRCGALIACAPGADCWCVSLPFQPMPVDGAGCLCRACLERRPANLASAKTVGPSEPG